MLILADASKKRLSKARAMLNLRLFRFKENFRPNLNLYSRNRERELLKLLIKKSESFVCR